MAADALRVFLRTKARSLQARARRLRELTPEMVGIRPQDEPYAPSALHFRAANERLREIDGQVRARLATMVTRWRGATPEEALVYMALVEREVDRARRTFGMF